jgi:hypothetical protein
MTSEQADTLAAHLKGATDETLKKIYHLLKR